MLRHRLPLLVTGIAGVARFNAFHHFHRKYPGQVVGLRPRQSWQFTGPGIVGQDIEVSTFSASKFLGWRPASLASILSPE